MFPIDSIEDNNPNDIIKVPINPTRIHEHNFSTTKEWTTLIAMLTNSYLLSSNCMLFYLWVR